MKADNQAAGNQTSQIKDTKMTDALATDLSREAMAALIWLRDTPHHIACWLVNGREPTTQPREEWTHFELRGRGGKRLCMPEAVWRAIGPYSTVAEDDNRIFAPTDPALRVLDEKGKRDA